MRFLPGHWALGGLKISGSTVPQLRLGFKAKGTFVSRRSLSPAGPKNTKALFYQGSACFSIPAQGAAAKDEGKPIG